MHILIIRPAAIGDTLLAFPVIEALRAQVVQAGHEPRITLVGNAAVLPLARACGIAEQVMDYEDPFWSVLFSVGPLGKDSLLRDMAVDMAICWLRDSEGLVERNLRAAGVECVIVAPGRPDQAKASGGNEQPVHVTDYLAHTIGVQLTGTPCYRHCFTTTLPPRQQASVAIHPGSGSARKCWPVARFAAVIAALWQREQGIPVLLLGGPADHERLAELLHHTGTPPRPDLLRVLLDKPLLDVAGELCGCRGYLGNDSGITHLAALLGLPTLALFGPTDPHVWHPQGRFVRILSAPDMGNLSVPAIMQTASSFFL
ncbi:MAG: glycosyltransferase family 9 protein [Ktedonobacteraceae bacterium]|nr:glycosyltransferase family 9 protein [Ktedonobacteraceae bacterium]